MNIIINGENIETQAETIMQLLGERKLNPQTTVVEKNGSIIGNFAYDQEPIAEQDELELIRFVGGG